MALNRRLFSKRLVRLLGLLAVILIAPRAEARQVCDDLSFDGHDYTVCTVDTRQDKLGLFWRNAAGKPFATFDELAASLAQTRKTLVFGMNAGMFRTDLSPVGLYIEDGEIFHRANTRDGPGNFHMKPNGIFYFGPDGAGVMETEAYLTCTRCYQVVGIHKFSLANAVCPAYGLPAHCRVPNHIQ